MYLNTLKPASGSKQKAKRVGRGIGSGLGKTCGRGHKGPHARSGGFHKVGFEGGQMPLQRRLPKFGFRSRKAKYAEEVRLYDLDKLGATEITKEVLCAAKLISQDAKKIKVIATGELKKALTIGVGIEVTKGARIVIEAVGGKVAE